MYFVSFRQWRQQFIKMTWKMTWNLHLPISWHCVLKSRYPLIMCKSWWILNLHWRISLDCHTHNTLLTQWFNPTNKYYVLKALCTAPYFSVPHTSIVVPKQNKNHNIALTHWCSCILLTMTSWFILNWSHIQHPATVNTHQSDDS